MNLIEINTEQLVAVLTKTIESVILSELPKIKQSQNTKLVYTIEDVCEMFQVSKRHLQYLRDSGQIGYVQNGRKILFRYEDLDAFFNKNYVKGGRN